MPDLCFVVPVYTVPYDYLQNCIDSIINQTYKNIELILVDDGSPDACGKICDDNAIKDERIKVIHKANGGLSDARNAGTRECTSNWITYVDGDDWVDLDFAEKFLNRVSGKKVRTDFYIYMGYRNYEGRQILGKPYYDDGTRFLSYEDKEKLQKACCLIPTLNNGESLFIGSACAKVYSMDFLRSSQVEFTVMPYGEDSIFYMYSIEMADAVEYVAEAYYHYRDTEGSMVNKFRVNADMEQDIYFNELFGFAKKYQKSEDFTDVLYLRVFSSMQRCICQKFYNPDNPIDDKTRKSECKKFFSKKPYCDAFSHICFWDLNKNSKIKYLLIKLRLYNVLVSSRRSYYAQNRKITQRR